MSNAAATPRPPEENTAKNPSPVDATTRPPCFVVQSRTTSSWTRPSATATSSPRTLKNSVEASVSVNRMVVWGVLIRHSEWGLFHHAWWIKLPYITGKTAKGESDAECSHDVQPAGHVDPRSDRRCEGGASRRSRATQSARNPRRRRRECCRFR